MKHSLPSGWKMTRLTNVGRVVTGTTPSKKRAEYFDGDVPFVTPSELDKFSPIVETPTALTELGGTKANLLPVGSVLVSCIGSLGKVGIAGVELATNQQINAVVPNAKTTDSRYLFQFCRTLKPVLEHIAPSTTLKIVKKSRFEALPIPLPPLPEQRRIAAILDKADAVRRKRQQTLDLADQFLRSAFLDMFGDPVTNPKGWPVKKLGDLLVFLTSGSRGWAKYYSDEGVAFLRIQNVGRNRLLFDDLAHVLPPDTKEAERTRVQPGDVVLSITADLGRAAVVPHSLGPTHVNQHLGLLRVEGIDPLYLAEFLISDAAQLQFRALDTGQTRSGLNFNDLKRLKVPCPPQELQKKLAALHAEIEALRFRLVALLTEEDNLANSLIQRVFRGELNASGRGKP